MPGADSESGLVYSVVGATVNVADVTQVDQLLHDEEDLVSLDAAYVIIEMRPEHAGRRVVWQIAARHSTYLSGCETSLGSGKLGDRALCALFQSACPGDALTLQIHPQARTTPAVRAEITRLNEPTSALGFVHIDVRHLQAEDGRWRRPQAISLCGHRPQLTPCPSCSTRCGECHACFGFSRGGSPRCVCLCW